MKTYVVLLLSLVSVNVLARTIKQTNNLKKATPYAKVVSPEELKKHLTIVASAEMEGRETATEGQRKAAAYIEKTMKETGLIPGFNGQYQKSYPVYRDSVTLASLSVNNIPFTWKQDFAPATSNFKANMSFSEVDYIDLEDTAWKNNRLDVSGKLVMFKLPAMKADEKGRKLAAIIGAVMRKGAAAALIIDPALKNETVGRMSLRNAPARQMLNYNFIKPEVAEAVFARGFDTSKLPYRIYRADVQLGFDKTQVQLESSNVLGYLEGTTKKDEFLIISAHYDHEGKKDSLIYYGADDDGSGTVSVLALAKAFAKAKAEGHGPARSILFLTVSGEEKGLWGSETYADNPVFPFAKTTADLNIDMIGRSDSAHIKKDSLNYVYLVGDNKLSTELAGIVESANQFTNLELNRKYNDPKDPEKIYYRSDHYNFAKKGVPVIFFYDGGNPDYHKPTDTVDKIDFELMSKRAKLVFYTAWEMANRPGMIVRDKSIKEN